MSTIKQRIDSSNERVLSIKSDLLTALHNKGQLENETTASFDDMIVAIDSISGASTIDSGVVRVQDKWEQIADYPDLTDAPAAACVNGKIYVVGGDNVISSWCNEYDPSLNLWQTKTNFSKRRCYLTASSYNGIVYAIGGNEAGVDSKLNEAYNPETNTWSSLTSMTYARFFLASTEYKGKIYVLGGKSGSTDTNYVEEYDPETNTWKTQHTIYEASGLCAVAANGKIYVFYGIKNTAVVNQVLEYIPELQLYISKTARGGKHRFGAVNINDKIYLDGGVGASTYTVTEVYDPKTDTWEYRENNIVTKSRFAYATDGKSMYTIAGYISSITNDAEKYTPKDVNYNFVNSFVNTSSTKPSMITGRYNSSSAVINDEIYVIGGYIETEGVSTDIVEIYNPKTNTWRSGISMPVTINSQCSSVVNSKIYVFSGTNTYNDVNNEFFTGTIEYDLLTSTWSTKANIAIIRRDASSCVVNNKIYLLGGYPQASTTIYTEEYNPEINVWTTKTHVEANSAYSTSRNGFIYSVGSTAGIRRYNTINDKSESVPKSNLITVKAYPKTFFIKNTLYVFGEDTSVFQSYDFDKKIVNSVTRTLDKTKFTLEVVNNKVYMIGAYEAWDLIEEYIPEIIYANVNNYNGDEILYTENLDLNAGDQLETIPYPNPDKEYFRLKIKLKEEEISVIN